MASRFISRLAAGALALVGILATSDAASAQAPSRPPNIMLILADDQRWDTIHALGNPEIHTPNLDRLVERGFHFSNAYCMGSMISAVCLPSRTMLITGRSLWRIPSDPRAKIAPPGVPLLPSVLSQAGYVTFHCGKDNNSCVFGNAAFDTNIVTTRITVSSAAEHADETIKFLERQDSRRPFFAYLAPPVPHDPRLAPAEFVARYDPQKISLSKNFLPQHPFDNGALATRDELLAAHPRTPDAMRQHLADYYATIAHWDHQVGRVLDELARLKLADNTIIVYSADQGLAVGGRHGLMGKQNLYEHVKPPLIFCGPGIAHGRSDALVYLFDLFPTICDLAGADTPAVVEGKSLLGIIRGNQAKVRDWLLAAYGTSQRMIRDQRWKLIEYNAAGTRNTQLFDLAHDPEETHNRAADPACATELQRLSTLLNEARQEFGDPM